jgi:hypothetical protein
VVASPALKYAPLREKRFEQEAEWAQEPISTTRREISVLYRDSNSAPSARLRCPDSTISDTLFLTTKPISVYRIVEHTVGEWYEEDEMGGECNTNGGEEERV